MAIFGQMSANNNLYNAISDASGRTSIQPDPIDWGGIINSGVGALKDVYSNYIDAQMQAAGMANAASAAAQQQQFLMNQDLMSQQMAYNAITAQQANAIQSQLQREAMLYNSTEADKNRSWQTAMSNTAYQRAVADMRAAGINPILAATNGGANIGSGSTASISTAKAAQSSGVSGSGVGNYSGQGYQLSDTFATFGAILGTVGNIMSALQANNGLKNALDTVNGAIRFADRKIAQKRREYIKNSKEPVYSQIKANNFYYTKEYAKNYGLPSIKA